MWMTLAALRSWQSTWPTLTRTRPPTSPTSGGRTTTLCGGPSSPTLCAHCARGCMTNPSRARLSIWRGGCGTRPIVRNKKVDLGKTCIKHSVSSSGCIPYVKKWKTKTIKEEKGEKPFSTDFRDSATVPLKKSWNMNPKMRCLSLSASKKNEKTSRPLPVRIRERCHKTARSFAFPYSQYNTVPGVDLESEVAL